MGRRCKYERRFIADQDEMSKAAPAPGFLKEGNGLRRRGCGGRERGGGDSILCGMENEYLL